MSAHPEAAQAERDAEIAEIRDEIATATSPGRKAYLESCIAELHVASGRCVHGIERDDDNGCDECREEWRRFG